MSEASAVTNHDDGVGASLVIVRVEDAIDATLIGRTGVSYESPPQTREQAMALVGVLLGSQSYETNGEPRWVTAIAGGRRTVTVEQP